MAIQFWARVKDTSASTGTGSFTVSGTPPAGFRTLSSVLAVGDKFYYCIETQTAGSWEVGIATYTGTNTFSRDVVTGSSNANALVNFSGATNVFITIAGDFLNSVWTNGMAYAERNGCSMP